MIDAITPQVPASKEERLRRLDLVLSAVAVALLAVPMAVALLIGRWERLSRIGRDGRAFALHRLALPDHLVGQALKRLGAVRWPELFNVIAGDMSWVGPSPADRGEWAAAQGPAVRPGLFNSWYVRRRTAVDFDGERSADAQDLTQRSVRHHLGVVIRALLVALLPEPNALRPLRLNVGDLTLDNLDMPEALSRIEALLDTGRGDLVCFVNPACVNIAATHRGYRRALSRAALVLPDGIGVKMAGDLLGTPLKQNVNGTDLLPRLLDRLARRRSRVFLLGGQPGVPERVSQAIGDRWPLVQVVGIRDGYFEPADEGAVVQAIRDSGADVLLVARGVPSQELFVDRHGPLLGVRLAIGVGGLFDFVSGRIPRAPQWMRDIGAEWVYRLAQEPQRLWRRYLVGNALFLARVLLQRWGWRRAATDPQHPGPSSLHDPASTDRPLEVRALIFATPTAHADIPVPCNEPAALLPAGTGTLIERQIEQLALAGIREIDIVACDAPERLRTLLGEGERWGVAITWHLVKDPARPYAPLRSSALGQAQRLVVAHADAWIEDGAVSRLVARDGAAVHVDAHGHRHWTGWASGPARVFGAVAPQSDRLDVESHVLRQVPARVDLEASQAVTRLDAAALLHLQSLASSHAAPSAVPLSWIVKPWGACSPQAHVHPDARIEGPVIIGSGSVIHSGARLGPNTWIGCNVVVSSDSHLQNALVLPGTYIGAALDVKHAIVNGPRLRSVRHAVEARLADGDSMLGSLVRSRRTRGAWIGRLVAGLGYALASPGLAPAAGAWWLAHRAWPWVRQPVVISRHDRSSQLTFIRLLACREPGSGVARWLTRWAMLTDVARGRRSWFGVRMRTPSQWYSLHAEWQQMLSGAPVGLLQAPAWFTTESQRSDAEAAADLFHITHAGWRENLRLGIAALRRANGKSSLPIERALSIPTVRSPL